jgi:hypothetical protein
MDVSRLSDEVAKAFRILNGVNSILEDQADYEREDKTATNPAPTFTAAELIGHIEDIRATLPNPNSDDDSWIKSRGRDTWVVLDRFHRIAVSRLTGVDAKPEPPTLPHGALSDDDRKNLLRLLRAAECGVGVPMSHIGFNAMVDAFSILKKPDRTKVGGLKPIS